MASGPSTPVSFLSTFSVTLAPLGKGAAACSTMCLLFFPCRTLAAMVICSPAVLVAPSPGLTTKATFCSRVAGLTG